MKPQDAHGPGPDPAHGVGGGLPGEAAADDHVGAVVEGGEQGGDLVGVVLAVAVELDGSLVAVAHGVEEAGAQGAADAEVERQGEDGGALGGGHRRGAVGGAVVHDDHVEARAAGQVAEDRRQGLLLVEGRDDHQGRGRARARLRLTSSRPDPRAWDPVPPRSVLLTASTTIAAMPVSCPTLRRARAALWPRWPAPAPGAAPTRPGGPTRAPRRRRCRPTTTSVPPGGRQPTPEDPLRVTFAGDSVMAEFAPALIEALERQRLDGGPLRAVARRSPGTAPPP